MRWSAILKRLALIPPTLLGVGAIVFVLLRVVPGDPIAMMIPPGASPAVGAVAERSTAASESLR